MRREFPRRIYVSMEDTAERRKARQDPMAYLGRLRTGAILDDVHRAPELAAAVAAAGGPWLLVSSRRLSLPLRTVRLYHPTRAELERRPPLPLEMLGHFVPAQAVSPRRIAAWPQPAIDEDVRELVQLRDADRFELFLEMARQKSGEVLDQQKLARQADVSRTTIVRWLAVLDTCFLTLRLAPLDDEFGRRTVRSPKLHFLGSGCFESKVVSEIFCNAEHSGQAVDLRYWRDSNGLEMPLIVRLPGARPVPVCIAENPNPADYARVQRWLKLAGLRSAAIISSRSGGHQYGPLLRYTADQL